MAVTRLCLSCCKTHEHGYCQACWEQQSRRLIERVEEPLEVTDPPAKRNCPWCGQWREQGSGHCECWKERR